MVAHSHRRNLPASFLFVVYGVRRSRYLAYQGFEVFVSASERVPLVISSASFSSSFGDDHHPKFPGSSASVFSARNHHLNKADSVSFSSFVAFRQRRGFFAACVFFAGRRHRSMRGRAARVCDVSVNLPTARNQKSIEPSAAFDRVGNLLKVIDSVAACCVWGRPLHCRSKILTASYVDACLARTRYLNKSLAYVSLAALLQNLKEGAS